MTFSEWPGYRAGHRWTQEDVVVEDDDSARSPATRKRTAWVRPLGVLECKFDKATQLVGQSDTFLRLKVSLPVEEVGETVDEAVRDSFVGRVLLAWASLRARHPLLACTIHDAPAETGSVIPLIQTRHFRFVPPANDDEAFGRAWRTMLVHDVDGGLDAAMDELQDQHVLNGERVLLDQAACLARLVLVRPRSSADLGFFLVISHVISDGLSVFKLVNELFTLASSPSRPSPTSPPTFARLDAHLSGELQQPPWSVPDETTSNWQLTLAEEAVLAHLPLASEEHYPVLPLLPPRSATPPVQPTENPSRIASPVPPQHSPPSIPHLRWLWAITRTILLQRQSHFPRTLYIPRLPHPLPPPQARNRWPRWRLEREPSSRVIRFCKTHSVSPSMLLYSLISLSLANVLKLAHPDAPYHPIVLGFPFSARPFLLPRPADSPQRPCSDPSSDLAIRITFGSIHLPNLPLDPNKRPQAEEIRQAALRGARLAKEQFATRLAPNQTSRTVFLAGMYGLILDRLLNSTGKNPIPYNEEKTALNASMIGDVDRLLATRFPSSPDFAKSPSRAFRLHDIMIGTRLHRGEGMLLEAFTWDGMITICLGVDDHLISPKVVEALLSGIRTLAEVVADE
ncbi:hypothetical protein NBRC10512_006223 [Rhodotorula toruloides]|uniref:RHTO0S05e03510g1_1 n=2 Tax=Rhodotorula toruloides TaxID=5286 RepID=A0A061ATE7_RHOTO|nr:uncharacterized protein RHTO_02487 [Rhodotorula toruloides NP11]EMS20871.1 hypothetical protein RHTO_02487 [Rhodotorula toruloides NP11]CDR40437.1 RHTO0S05e03510g1_1 [Rhodotorula toruloides]